MLTASVWVMESFMCKHHKTRHVPTDKRTNAQCFLCKALPYEFDLFKHTPRWGECWLKIEAFRSFQLELKMFSMLFDVENDVLALVEMFLSSWFKMVEGEADEQTQSKRVET